MLPIICLQLIMFSCLSGVLSSGHNTEEPSASGDLPVGLNAANVMLSTFDSDPDFRRPSQENEQDLPHDADFTPSPLWNVDNVWPPPSSSNADTFGPPVKRAANDFIRLGRSRSNAFMRLGRGDSGFIRFGRSNGLPSSTGKDIGRRDSGFLRFGRANGENAMQYGGFGDLVEDNMRFGRRGDKFIRFGRSQGQPRPDVDVYYGNSLDRENGKRYEDIIGGKSARAQSFIRLGRAKTDHNSFIRLGRIPADDLVGVRSVGQPWAKLAAAKISFFDDTDEPATPAESGESRLTNDNDFSSEK